MAEAIPVEDLKQRQAAVMVEMHDARRLIDVSQNNMAVIRERLELMLKLLRNAGKLYRTAAGEQRKWLNLAVFNTLAIDVTGDDETHPTQETLSCETTGYLTEPVAAVVEMAQQVDPATQSGHVGGRGATRLVLPGNLGPQGGQKRNPRATFACRGFQRGQLGGTGGI